MARFPSRLIKFVFILLALLLLTRVSSSSSSTSHGPMTFCSDVFGHFQSCIGFLTGLKPDPAYACCVAISQLNKRARRAKDGPKAICQCIEDASYVTKALFVASRIHELSPRCHQIHRSFPISIGMDCSKA